MNDFTKINFDSANTADVTKRLLLKYNSALDSINSELFNITARYNLDGKIPNSMEFRKGQLQEIKKKVIDHIQKLGNDTVDATRNSVYSSVQDSYYHTAYQLGTINNNYTDFTALNFKSIDNILLQKLDGETFSNRIWNNTAKLALRVEQDISKAVVNGDSTEKLARKISKDFNSGFYNASRVINTETARAVTQGQMKAYEESGVVKEVMWDATLENNTCEHCADLDGKRYKLDKAPYLPAHPCCRCCLIPCVNGFIATEKLDNENKQVIKYNNYKEWYKDKYGNKKPIMPKPLKPKDKPKLVDVMQTTTKIKNSMSEGDYVAFMNLVQGNEDVAKLYVYADRLSSIKRVASGGMFRASTNSIEFTYPLQKYIDAGMSKYKTVAHEYGHFFDKEINIVGLHYTEIDTVNEAVKIGSSQKFKPVLSNSDEFLEAVRKDKKHIKSLWSTDMQVDLMTHDTSAGVQDAIDGMFGKRIKWGHGDRYYNREYNDIKYFKKEKELKQAYIELGFDAGSQAKVKGITRIYETASELWANILSAETTQGEALEYAKKYLPNSYDAMKSIIRKVVI